MFSYRFYTLDNGFPQNNIRQLVRDGNGNIAAGRRIANVFTITPTPATGEFLQIRFGTNQTTNGGGVFNLDDVRTRQNTEAFLRTVDFLLDTNFGDRIFVWHGNTAENSPNLSGTGDNNRAQLVILIYLDHTRWERRP